MRRRRSTAPSRGSLRSGRAGGATAASRRRRLLRRATAVAGRPGVGGWETRRGSRTRSAATGGGGGVDGGGGGGGDRRRLRCAAAAGCSAKRSAARREGRGASRCGRRTGGSATLAGGGGGGGGSGGSRQRRPWPAPLAATGVGHPPPPRQLRPRHAASPRGVSRWRRPRGGVVRGRESLCGRPSAPSGCEGGHLRPLFFPRCRCLPPGGVLRDLAGRGRARRPWRAASRAPAPPPHASGAPSRSRARRVRPRPHPARWPPLKGRGEGGERGRGGERREDDLSPSSVPSPVPSQGLSRHPRLLWLW
eukprot:Rhum_TRINITY_DN14257_c7_g1::Rhum_TRINITY_DN14257_c7_g1_i1::g.76057::m.76057